MSLMEMKVTDQFHHGRRNLLLVSSIAIVLWLAIPTEIKVPGLGTDVKLPANTTFILVGAALLYFLVRYLSEILLIISMNSQAIDDTDGPSSVTERVDHLVSGLEELQSKLNKAFTGPVQALDRTKEKLLSLNDRAISLEQLKTHLHQSFASYARNKLAGRELISSEFAEWLSTQLNNMMVSEKAQEIEKISEIERGLKAFDLELKELSEAQLLVAKKMDDLGTRLGKLSSRLGAVQRLSFRIWDAFIPCGLGLIGILACIDGGVAHFSSQQRRPVSNAAAKVQQAVPIRIKSGE
jgi:hypothetical protein